MCLIRELVKYRNDLNSVIFKNFNRKEQNLFFALVSRMRNKDTRVVKLPFAYLMRLSGNHYENHRYRFVRDCRKMYKKVLGMTIYRKGKHGRFDAWVLFTSFHVLPDKQEVQVKVNPDLVGVLNDLASHFTRFSMLVFTHLHSSYSKTMFRICNQFRTTGLVNLPMKKFKILLGVPKSLTNGNITKRVLKPIWIELTPRIRGFRIQIIRHGIGGKITGYRITFKPQRNKQDYTSNGRVSDRQMMLDNIHLNPYLPSKLRRPAQAYVNDLFEKRTHKAKKEPMKVFNHMLATAPLSALEMYNRMRKRHDPTVNFSEYQGRKLRRRIKELKSKQIDKTLIEDAKERKAHEVNGQFKPVNRPNSKK